MYTFTMSYNNNEVVMVFPVTPNDGIQVSRSMANTTYDGLNGQINLLGRGNLRSFSLSSIFPCKSYNWANIDSGTIYKVANAKPTDTHAYYDGYAGYHYESVSVLDGKDYVELIENGRDRLIPFRAILTRDGDEVFNFPVTVTNFQWGYDQAGDIAYTMDCVEYVFPTYSKTELAETSASDGVDTEDKSIAVDSSSIAPTATAIDFTFDESQYKKYYTQNDVYMLAVSICSAQGLTGNMYYNPSTHKYSKTQQSGYTITVTPKMFYAAHCWCFCNQADSEHNKVDVSQRITKHTADAYNGNFDWYDKYKSKIYDLYGVNAYEVAEDVLKRWSAEKQGATNVGRLLPKEYVHYYGTWEAWQYGLEVFYNFWYKSVANGQGMTCLNWFKNGGYTQGWGWTLPSPY